MYEEWDKIKRKCEICNKIFMIKKNRLKWGRGKTCSKQCRIKYVSKKLLKKILLKCTVCGKDIFRSKSQIKSKNVFCSLKCKAKGMSLGLVADMRKGTGISKEIKYYKLKYYKYRKWDKDLKVPLPDYSVWNLVNRLKNGNCYYCESDKELGLDRINNQKGHTRKNTVVCCNLCNMTRGNRFTKEQMKKIGKVIKSFRRG